MFFPTVHVFEALFYTDLKSIVKHPVYSASDAMWRTEALPLNWKNLLSRVALLACDLDGVLKYINRILNQVPFQ